MSLTMVTKALEVEAEAAVEAAAAEDDWLKVEPEAFELDKRGEKGEVKPLPLPLPPAPSVHDSYDYLCKLLVIGDSGCGKSALLKSFCGAEFNPVHTFTIGVDFETRILEAQGKKVKMQMWDTAGQERFRTITSSFYRGAHAAMIVFDVTQEESFRGVAQRLGELHVVRSGDGDSGDRTSNVPVLLVANKTDLTLQRVVEPHRIAALAVELGLPFIETSAKSNTNVAEAFQTIAHSFVLQQRAWDSASGDSAFGACTLM